MNPCVNIVAEAAELSPTSVKVDSAFANLNGWDSFCLMRLITLIESNYSIEMSAEDIVKLQSVPDVERYLQAQGKIE